MKIHYVTGSRADFGLMRRCLEAIATAPTLDLGIVVTGQHTVERYGDTSREVRDSNLRVVCEIPVPLTGAGGAEMARGMALEISGFVEIWERERPDLVLVLGDRGEMLAATLAAVHMGIFVTHIHGGELSGTLDESLRHAISKLAHFHLVATEDSAERLRHMGERSERISIIGAPGLVGINVGIGRDRDWLVRRFGLSTERRIALVVFHPVVQEAAEAGRQVRTVVDAVAAAGLAQIVMRPNSDAGGKAIDDYLDGLGLGGMIQVETHFDRDTYLKVLASCDLMVGNSSSGIIESASFDVSCVNVGSRQDGRFRDGNTIDVPNVEPHDVRHAIEQALRLTPPFRNDYGNGTAGAKMVKFLSQLHLDPAILKKRNAY
jgi:GDP/UDP-N,N'-diacetylbacillosamine 2-epimerase (hydrolysing)